jgi:DNA-binding NtrC family response regulator
MKKRILVADDDPSVRESLKKILEETGHDVTVVCDGSEAEAALVQRPDLLILDLNMPRRDGWDVLERAGSVCPLLPVIVITGMPDQLDTTVIPGVATLMAKPVEVAPLLKIIEDLLSESMEDRLRRNSTQMEAKPLGRTFQ